MRRAALLVLLAMSSTALADDTCVIDRDIVRCRDWKLEWIGPEGWEVADLSAYPGVLVVAIHRRGGGRITVAAQKLKKPLLADAVAQQSRAVMERMGYRLGRLGRHATGGYIHEAVAPDGATVVRQGYFVHNDVAYVITLAAPQNVMRIYVRAFDDSLRNLSVRRAAAPAAAEPAPPADAADRGDTEEEE
jgi:hypothetical protein